MQLKYKKYNIQSILALISLLKLSSRSHLIAPSFAEKQFSLLYVVQCNQCRSSATLPPPKIL